MAWDYGRWFERGRVHQKAGRPLDAMVCYQRALQSNVPGPEARFRLGEVLRELGRHAEARTAWHTGLELDPAHLPMQLMLADTARQTGAYAEAIAAYRAVLASRPSDPEAALGLALSRLAAGDEEGYAELEQQLGTAATDSFWNELAIALAKAPPSPARSSLLRAIASAHAGAMPALMLACAAEDRIANGEIEPARAMLARAEALVSALEDPETLRRLALVAARVGSSSGWAARYAQRCMALSAGPSLEWPRRTAGTALRLAYLVSGGELTVDGKSVATETYLQTVVAAHPREHIAATVWVVGDALPAALSSVLPREVPIATLGSAPDPLRARRLLEADADALVDLVGCAAAIGPLLAQRPARTVWTYPGLSTANVAPLITHALPELLGGGVDALVQHRAALERSVVAACSSEAWFADVAPRTAAELGTVWQTAVDAHQSGKVDAALAGYADVLAEQPKYARGQYLLGMLLRDRGERSESERALRSAIEFAPSYVEARVALAGLFLEKRFATQAAAICEQGLRDAPNEVALWRSLGLARLARHEAAAARKAFRRALALAPTHAKTHYNEGVALQMLRNDKLALRSYYLALALDPGLVAAYFNVGVILRDQGRTEPAIEAFEKTLALDLGHVPAHKALADTLHSAGRLDEWFMAFERFEVTCPSALPLLIVALEACQYRADFRAVDRYLDRLQRDEFKASSETELADCLEELLYLLLFFDFDPEAQWRLYKAYDKVAPRVYGTPRALPAERRAGRIRIGYLSGDLRNHVMGKMMWPALQRHDRDRFELFFYSLSTASDEWTARYRALGDHFEVIAELPEAAAAERIGADELDILVDLSTHTRGAKPGILALKPARVQITHVASAGAVGLSTIDFKLTDAYADLPDSQAYQLETLLPMNGCVYPYRHIAPAKEHPFHREGLQIPPHATVIGGFVNPLKLSRRCLGLWREVLERLPDAVLAISPLSRPCAGSTAICCPPAALRPPASWCCRKVAMKRKIRRATN
jgi:protein O-GlcNAc transferase